MVKIAKSPAETLADLVEGATSKWAKQRKAEERNQNTRHPRRDLWKPSRITLKDAAWNVMERAYMAASANGTLPANPRQIMYAARPRILELTGKESLDSQYFCQNLLVDYIREHDLEWDIAWDDRGHFVEPHTNHRIGLGTLAVREYVACYAKPSLKEAEFAPATVKTRGPDCRFGALLYIEKEGFMPLLERSRIAEKFDIGIMSCKGMSVTAARLLIDRTCARYGIPLLTLHDFDISGFSIAGTLSSDTRRFIYESKLNVVDLGLRLSDVQELSLDSERVSINRDGDKLRSTLCRHGARPDEIDFLLCGQRVELNAMTSDIFIAFIERKLTEAGVQKVIPPKDQLDAAYRLFARGERIKEAVDEAIAAHTDDAEVAVPDDLEALVRDYLSQNPYSTWEGAVAEERA